MKTIAISASSNGDNTLLAAVTGRRIVVIAFALSFSGTVNAKFKDGASTDLSGLYYGVADTFVQVPALPLLQWGPIGHFATSQGNALVLNLSAGVAVGGHVVYDLQP